MLFGLFKKKSPSKDSNCSELINPDIREKTSNNLSSPISVSISTNPGCIRDVNEDNFFVSNVGSKPCPAFSCNAVVNENNIRFFAVFDGMGGEAFGEEASNIASGTLAEFSANYHERCNEELDIIEMIKQFVSLANNRICEMIAQKKCNRSGCTMALIVLWREMVYAFSIGDSRIYRCHNNGLEQVSEDQTLAIKKLKANIYTEDEARNSPDAHKITSYIGLDSHGVGVPYHAYEPLPFAESILLLCSDGLTDMCADDEIKSILLSDDDTPAKSLVELAIKNGGEDNITCIVIKSDD